MVTLVLVAGGFVAGLVVRRWWALVLPAGLGVWIALKSELEVPGWFLGLYYGALAGVGVGLGVLVGRRLARGRRRSAQPPM
jgi:hypothetical protein